MLFCVHAALCDWVRARVKRWGARLYSHTAKIIAVYPLESAPLRGGLAAVKNGRFFASVLVVRLCVPVPSPAN